MSERTFAELREEYAGEPLDEATVAADPVEQFRRWFDDAVRASIRMANGMTLATVSADGQPSARIVLLKGYDERGFVFYTHYESRKAAEIEASGRAALLFWWQPIDRQVRIEGEIERVSKQESDAYFATRPRASNLSAMASPQSRSMPDREWLQARVADLEQQRGVDDVLVRPETWGGYRVMPRLVEFWQGRPNRLHDRLCYRRHEAAWQVERLAP